MSSSSSRALRTKSMNAARLLRVHPGRRLVEQQQLRLGGERAGDLEPALVAVGEVVGVLALEARRHAAVGEQLAGALARLRLLAPLERRAGRRCRTRRSRRRQCIPTSTFSSDGHRAEEPDVLERAADAERRDLVLREPGDVAPVEDDLARRRRVGAGEHVEERRLAGAVRADQARDRAAREPEVDVGDGDEAAELLAQPCGRRSGDRCRPAPPWRRPSCRRRLRELGLDAPGRPRAARPCGARSGSGPRAGAA